MRYVDEFRDPGLALALARRIRRTATRPWRIMEVCGGQTHTIIREGLDQLLPEEIELVHGPGCPVCVTPLEILDRALALAARPEVILCSFGDMLRVPGSSSSLMEERAQGADGGEIRDHRVFSRLDHFALAEHRLASVLDAVLQTAHAASLPGSADFERIRVRYAKTGAMIFLSHLELLTLFTRAVKRAGIPVKFSQGFHPHPKFSFATALSVGVESSAEYLDMEIEPGFGADSVRENLNLVLPQGITVTAATSVPAKSPSLSAIMERVRYRITLPEGTANLPQQVEAFLEQESHPFSRVKKSGLQEYDLRHELHCLSAAENCLTMEIGRGKPLEFVAAITGLEPDRLKECRIEKLAVIFKDSSFSI